MQGTPGCAPDASTYASLIQALAAMSQHAQVGGCSRGVDRLAGNVAA